MATGDAGAYWLAGEEHCPHCLQRYTFAVERHCARCDGPGCPHCVTVQRETRELVCTRCLSEPDDEQE